MLEKLRLKANLEEKSLGDSRSRRASVPIPLFEVQLNLPAKGSRLATETLYRELRAAMIDGRLLVGTQLPPARKSEAFFGVSRNTVVQVYEKLANEGYVKTRHGSGTYVAKRRSVPTTATERVREILPDRRLSAFWMDPAISSAIGFWRDEPAPPHGTRHSRHVDFRPALVDARLFPFNVFRRVIARQLRELERRGLAEILREQHLDLRLRAPVSVPLYGCGSA